MQRRKRWGQQAVTCVDIMLKVADMSDNDVLNAEAGGMKDKDQENLLQFTLGECEREQNCETQRGQMRAPTSTTWCKSKFTEERRTSWMSDSGKTEERGYLGWSRVEILKSEKFWMSFMN